MIHELRARTRELAAPEGRGHVNAGYSGLAGGVENCNVGALNLAVQVVALLRSYEPTGGAVGRWVRRVGVRERCRIVDDHHSGPRRRGLDGAISPGETAGESVDPRVQDVPGRPIEVADAVDRDARSGDRAEAEVIAADRDRDQIGIAVDAPDLAQLSLGFPGRTSSEDICQCRAAASQRWHQLEAPLLG